MPQLNKFINGNPYALKAKDKDKIFSNILMNLTRHHYRNCKLYKKIINNLQFNINYNHSLEKLPMIPERIFKKYDLKSVPDKEIILKLVSSGTTGHLSKIYLDKYNAKNQTKVLQKIISTILGNKRLPMLIIDQNPKIVDRQIFNAKSAAIYGFSLFGKDYCYLLKNKNSIDYKSLNIFLKKFAHKKFFIFGFTNMIYEHLIKKSSPHLLKYSFEKGILLHGGGWKKLDKIKINNNLFKKKLRKKIKLRNIYNYYGLVEQTGSIFLECKCGYFVTSAYSDIFIRDKKFNIQKKGRKGLLQLLSLLPTSYPGHNILTEDIGEMVDKNKCKCGIKGKFFLVHGRAKQTEIRGCSDAK